VVYLGKLSVLGISRPELRVLDVGTRAVTPLHVLGLSPRWSPTEDRIAYVDDESRVVLIDPDGGNRRVLSAPGRTYEDGLDWSPDGRWVVVRAVDRPNIELIHAQTGETLPLPLSAGLEQPAWRPTTP
jgi:dipeptidyl aminopeptidase/acylaminoacyl peptidase